MMVENIANQEKYFGKNKIHPIRDTLFLSQKEKNNWNTLPKERTSEEDKEEGISKVGVEETTQARDQMYNVSIVGLMDI